MAPALPKRLRAVRTAPPGWGRGDRSSSAVLAEKRGAPNPGARSSKPRSPELPPAAPAAQVGSGGGTLRRYKDSAAPLRAAANPRPSLRHWPLTPALPLPRLPLVDQPVGRACPAQRARPCRAAARSGQLPSAADSGGGGAARTWRGAGVGPAERPLPGARRPRLAARGRRRRRAARMSSGPNEERPRRLPMPRRRARCLRHEPRAGAGAAGQPA